MRLLVSVTLILGGLVGGCGNPPATRTAPPPVPADTPTATALATGDAGITPPMALLDGGTVVLPSARSSLIFTDITGRTGDQTAVLFTPTAQAIEACHGPRGGKLVIHLHADKGRLIAEPQAGSSLDPTAKQCVLDALTRSQIDELAAGSNVKPTGFTSLLTVEW